MEGKTLTELEAPLVAKAGINSQIRNYRMAFTLSIGPMRLGAKVKQQGGYGKKKKGNGEMQFPGI